MMCNSTKFYCFLLFSTLLCGNSATAQQTPNKIIYDVYHKMENIKAYQADVRIVADLPLLRIMPVNATLYYTQQEKFKLVSKGIAVLPRQGLNDLPAIIADTNSFTAITTGNEMLNGVSTVIINVIPFSDTGNVVLAKLWIDPVNSMVYKSQVTTRENGTLVIEYFYSLQKSKGLPDKIIFTVDIKKFKLPKGVATDINRTKTEEKSNKKESKYGKIFMSINNYIF